MTDALGFSPLVGRSTETRELHTKICQGRCTTLVVTGSSGVGKTAIVDHFAALMRGGHERFRRIWFQSLYRTSWTSAIADLRRRLDWAPKNATVNEIESLVLAACRTDPTLIVLDNVDDGNVAHVVEFVARWQAEITESSLVITGQPHIAQQFDDTVPTLRIMGIQSPVAVLDLFGELTERFPERTLLEVGQLVEGNPQKLLFLNWIAPTHLEELIQRATNLKLGDDQFAIEDSIKSAGIPSLFFLALGIHRSFVVTDRLLTALWDAFSSRGAAAYVRVREVLLQKKILAPVQEYVFSIHESVHLQLEKALVHRVGPERIPLFHRFFAEYYEGALRDEVTTTNLTHFIHHSLAAKSYTLAFRQVVDGRAAQALATRGSAILVRQELEKLDTADCLSHATPLDEVSLYLRLGGLCNDLSDHEATLRYMARAESVLNSTDDSRSSMLRRQLWYYRAVSYSNLGQSDRCIQEYFRIVDSCVSDDDDLACLSLGYLAHDLKYRDLSLALELGKMSVDWSAKCHPNRILPRNACSYAESLVVAGDLDAAIELFGRAAGWAEEQHDQRELGRIQTNWGLALALTGHSAAMGRLQDGKRSSASVGDRRRQTQAVLYTGLAKCLAGDHDDGGRLIRQAADLLHALGDGRYFVPALCWTLQVAGVPPRLYPSDSTIDSDIAAAGCSSLVDHARSHPEFAVYHQFWWRHFSDLLRK